MSSAACDEFERQFALADGAVAGEQHADAEDFQQHAVHAGRIRQRLRQVMAQHQHQLRALLLGGKQRRLGAFRCFHQQLRHGFAVGYDDGGQLP